WDSPWMRGCPAGTAFVSHPRSPAPLGGARAPRATAEDRTWSGRWTGRPPLGSGGHPEPPPAPRGERRRCAPAGAATRGRRAVALDVDALQVLQEALALTDQQHQTTTGVVIVLVGLEVLGQVVDPMREERDLDLGRTGVALGGPVLLDDLLLRSGVEGHGSPGSLRGAPDLMSGLWDERARRRTGPEAGTTVGADTLSAADVTAREGYQPVTSLRERSASRVRRVTSTSSS